jgi:hypothetical protein
MGIDFAILIFDFGELCKQCGIFLFFIFHFITNIGLTVNKVEHDMIIEIEQE